MSPGIVAESDLSGALTSEYVFFGGERVARKDYPSDTVSYYFFSNHLRGLPLFFQISLMLPWVQPFLFPWPNHATDPPALVGSQSRSWRCGDLRPRVRGRLADSEAVLRW